MDEFVSLPGEVTEDFDQLRPRARSLAVVLHQGEIPFARLISIATAESCDIVTMMLDVEVAQERSNDVRPHEQIAVEFAHDDSRTPEVFALRKSFPRVPHLNLRGQEIPRSLCVFEEPWPEVKLWWTPARFIAAIRHWLGATSRDELHTADQVLEPLLLGAGVRLVVPADLDQNDEPIRLDVVAVKSGDMQHPVLIARRPAEVQRDDGANGIEFVATRFVGNPMKHGVIRKTPRALSDLAAVLADAGQDLVAELSERLTEWSSDPELLARKLILIVFLPKVREDGGNVESTDVFAFVAIDPISSIGERMGLWEIQDGHAGALIGGGAVELDKVALDCLHPVADLSVDSAARLAGEELDARNVVAVGQGALGSQVVANLLRVGFGRWTLVDRDVLLPHNLSRHALLGRVHGFPKADYMAGMLLDTMRGATVEPIVCDVLSPGDHEAGLRQAMSEAGLICDFSASTAVSRHLASMSTTEGRRVAAFLSPDGRCLVLLAEEAKRSVTLDELEPQLLRLILRVPALADFFGDRGRGLRYGGSCGDLSALIPQDHVALHSALASRAILELPECPMVNVWRLDEALSVQRYAAEGSPTRGWEGDGWSVRVTERTIEELVGHRASALPSETGGVLLGSVDAERRMVHVVDAMQPPPDSGEWPDAFIRGSAGLRRHLEQIEQLTGHSAHYVGEWHSHPPGASLSMSPDDEHLLAVVSQHMSSDGLPGISLIVGDGEAELYLRCE